MASKTLERLQTRLAKLYSEREHIKASMIAETATLSHIEDDVHWTRMTIQDEEDRAKADKSGYVDPGALGEGVCACNSCIDREDGCERECKWPPENRLPEKQP